MGISAVPGWFLARHAKTVQSCARAGILGRAKMHLNDKKIRRFLAVVNQEGFNFTEEDVLQEDGWSEKFFAALGYPVPEVIDFTDQEGAQHVVDLNHPIPEEMHNQFDLLIDNGTTEHIFNIAQALENCEKMIKPGGYFICLVAGDGWFGHGFWQTGPDIPWGFWHRARGYEVIEACVQSRDSRHPAIPIPNTLEAKRGGEMFLQGPHMILYVVRKPLEGATDYTPVQSHYIKYSHISNK